jgi:lipocalin
LIKRYQVLYTQKKLNEENLKELIKKAKELGFDNEEELRAMIM